MLVALFPVVWMLITAFNDEADLSPRRGPVLVQPAAGARELELGVRGGGDAAPAVPAGYSRPGLVIATIFPITVSMNEVLYAVVDVALLQLFYLDHVIRGLTGADAIS